MPDHTTLLPPGSTVTAVAPSHRFDEDRYRSGRSTVESHGYRIVEQDGLRERHRWFAGTDEHRLTALKRAFARPDSDAVWAVRGGSGMTRILPHLDFNDLVIKPIIGFSDLTPLLDQIARAGGTAIHGPVLHSLPSTDPTSVRHLFDLLAGRAVAPMPGRTMVAGAARGPLVGGNLCMLASTCGTPFQLDARGCILVIEEVGEPLYRVDRMLQQLVSAGVFRDVIGVAVGAFTGCGAHGDSLLDDVLDDHLDPLNVPVTRDLPIGHGAENRAWIVRSTGELRDGALVLASTVG
ncbi:MAG: muramoyltetrapeptide carboxypeptidase [Kiritimatiellia bacterium]|jgi:muramoyltetrapeptide carboxypeptidase